MRPTPSTRLPGKFALPASVKHGHRPSLPGRRVHRLLGVTAGPVSLAYGGAPLV